MCLVLASDKTVFLDWMQDIIFCVPMIPPDEPGKKIVITTVALRSPTDEQKPVFLYYAEPIDGSIVDLSTTLPDESNWITKLSLELGHIAEITPKGDVRLPERPGGNRESDDFTPLGYSGQPPEFPLKDGDFTDLVEASGLGNRPLPFTKVNLPAHAFKQVIIRFGFVMGIPDAPKNNRETAFTFLGPKQIVDIIDDATDRYLRWVSNETRESFSQKEKTDLHRTIANQQKHSKYAGNNGLYHLLLCVKPPHYITAIEKVSLELARPCASRWLSNEEGSQPDDFQLSGSDKDSQAVLMHQYETRHNTFTMGFTAKVAEE